MDGETLKFIFDVFKHFVFITSCIDYPVT